MFTFKVSDEITLHLLTEEHIKPLLALIKANRDMLQKWQPHWNNIKNEDDLKNLLKFNLERFAKNNGFLTAIYHKDIMAGVISCNEIDWKTRRTNIGYWLGEAFQGQGLVTKSCRVMIDYFFDELKLNHIEIDPAIDNLKSRAVPERLGFVQEGILRQRFLVNDQLVDAVVYGLLASEWNKNR